MPFHNMLDDREAEASAPKPAAAAGVDAIETLSQPWNMFGRYPFALIRDLHVNHPTVQPGRDADGRSRLPIAQGVGDEIVEDLQYLLTIRCDGREVGGNVACQFRPAVG